MIIPSFTFILGVVAGALFARRNLSKVEAALAEAKAAAEKLQKKK